MNRLFTILSALLLTLLSTCLYAQKTNNDYNLKKAYEVLNEEKDEAKALDLVNKQLRETPDNVDALVLRVRLLRRKQDYGQALQDINHALKVNKPKKTEVAMSTLHWWKAFIYQDMRDKEKAVASFKTAYDLGKKDNKDNLQSIAFDYAQALYFNKDHAASDAIYHAMLKEDEADVAAMVGLARNMLERNEYKEAVEILEKCQKYDADYSEVYRFKLRAYKGLKEYGKAIDAGLDWYDKNSDADTDTLFSVMTKRPNYAEANIKSRGKKSENGFAWKALLCQFYEHTHRYADAIKCYDEVEAEYGHYDAINVYRSDCYSELGLNDLAIADISKVMEKEPTWNHFCTRGDYYRLSGNLDAAIADFSAAIEEEPSYAYAYYKRGWCYEMQGDREKAMEDYNLGIEMDEDYPYLNLMRGELLLQEGNKADADIDFETVLQKDTVATAGSCRQYALHFLGRDKEAEEWMDKIIAEDPERNGGYYDRACLYSRMGRLDESIAALRVAFEKGYRDFAHLVLDDDMDAVRDLPEFKALVAEYKAMHDTYLKESEIAVPESEETITELSLIHI